MKPISFKILISCILLPPMLYIASLIGLEHYLTGHYREIVKGSYLGDTRSLFEGQVHLKDAVQENIDNLLRNSRLIRWGVDLEIVIKTERNTYLYPAIVENPVSDLGEIDPMTVASENYRLMNEGVDIDIEVAIRHGSPLSNSVLGAYILIALGVMVVHYRKGSQHFEAESQKSRSEIERLRKLEQDFHEKLTDLGAQRDTLAMDYAKLSHHLEKETQQAIQNEEGWIQEIEGLEAELKSNLERQHNLQAEIDQLRSVIKEFEKSQDKLSKQKERVEASVRKRFNTLYKNITIYDQAIEGFVDLPEQLKIKGEEIIHKLDGEPDKVQVKRKVFGKKNRKTVLEVIFGYKGRLYFRKTSEQRIEVVAIGTKNNQIRDLDFIDSL